ncbi:hypothetical protein FB451DRAFT_1172998 [Mycena latifolia]|nr:hypothetical protein FB451DRAFT_1172998 [Mycena latifolia]
MAANFGVAATAEAVFPEDIERAINEVLLNDTREMCGTMSLVASRFRTWAKPIAFRTVSVRRHNNWTQRIGDCLLSNASFIRILVLDLDLPFTEGRGRGQLPEEELSLIRRLLEASGRVRHLAVTWNIWAHLPRECGALRLSGLYLIWDRGFHIYAHGPSLHNLQYPAALEDLTVYAPADLRNPMPFRTIGRCFLPVTRQCVNLAYVTYAADRMPCPGVEDFDLRGAMLVLVGMTEPHEQTATEIKTIRDRYPNFSAVLVEWVAKMEGRESLLDHARATATLDNN